MEEVNLTQISEFLLLGFSEDPKQQQLLFVVFMSMYLVTGMGNLLIILAIGMDARLHTPMYFFLANLAFVDICFISTTVPKMLAIHVSGRRGIPYAGCLTQTFFFIFRLSFCNHNRVPHFFCDLSPLLKLACSDTFLNNVMVNTVGALTLIMPFVGILVSYTRIVAAVLRIPSAGGRRKAFSTCGSHLSVVTLYYGTFIGVYFSPTSSHTAQKDTATSVIYTVVTPMLNPFIYSLRNSDMKGALGALVRRRPASIR
ncbi:Olfactory receptor 7D4 [Tupaia chinensis]|uniref:Olfactory receptor 7D4 n=1 Tax=Tupaia chinensis TaxID=246437 RepID=L9KW02_TUPCH|nr:Olfactory receptor 7D4 [Tupaia chinensis]